MTPIWVTAAAPSLRYAASMHDLLSALVAGAQPTPPSDAPLDTAMITATHATTIGAAFLASYRAALRALVPSLPRDRVACLCATEEGGAHPRAIQTRLEPDGGGFRVSGRKRWVTGGPHADLLLVVASTGSDAEGRNALRLVQVDAHAPGVTLHKMPDPPFTPEIPHAEVELRGVTVESAALLPGDGYARYLKPFRTVEDAHVWAGVLAWLCGVARRARWPHEARERLVALALATRSVAAADPSARETHVALAGVLALGRRAVDETGEHWSLVDPDCRARWERDRPLLGVAEKARAARRLSAWQSLDPA